MRRVCAVFLLLTLAVCSDPTEPAGDGSDDEPTGVAYDESQDGVLFVSNRYGIYTVFDLFRMNLDGNGVENLTLEPARYYGQLAMSPDRSRIAFNSDRVSCYNIWVMNVDGTDLVQLTGVDSYERCNKLPFWSPDGSRIAFMSSREPQEGWQVYVIHADGTDPRKVSIVPDVDGVRGAGPLGWTPDGRVVFQLVTDSAATIYAVAPDGTGAEPLFDEPDVRHPVWSPDGERLAFIRRRDGVYSLIVRDGDGTEETLVVTTDEPGSYMSIASAARSPWSPDGSHLAFHTAEDWTRQLVVVDVDGGTGYRQLTDDPDHSSFFNSWSPDGTRIAFTSDRDGTDDVYLIDADGTGRVKLTDSPAEDSDALWLPAR